MRVAYIHGSISFALVDIPITLSPIIKDNDVSFQQIHKKCGKRISYMKYCNTCKRQVKSDEILKGYAYEKNHYVTFEASELSKLKRENDHEIEILSFISLKEVDPAYFSKSYVLLSSGKGKSYSLFWAALKKTGLAALCRTTFNQKFSYCIVRIHKDYLILTTLYFHEEIVLPEKVKKKEVNDKELSLAIELIKSLKSKFEPEKYIDEYQNRLKEAIEDKIEGKSIKKVTKKKSQHVNDLLKALEKSLKK